MPRISFKAVPEICSVCALMITPIVMWATPQSWLIRSKVYGLEVKNLLTIGTIIALSIIILILRIPTRVRPYLNFSPYYETVEHSFFYYEDGTVVVRSVMILGAGWQKSLSTLPTEGFLWFNEIPRDRLHYRLIHLGNRKDRKLDAEQPSIAKLDYKGPRSGENETKLLSWTPLISPPVGRFETVAYQAEVTTPGTESAAFHPEGTTLGFGVSIKTCKVTLRAYAPPGYIFRLMAPESTVRDFETALEISVPEREHPRASLSVDHSVIEVVSDTVRKGRRYWYHYRFEKVGIVKERDA